MAHPLLNSNTADSLLSALCNTLLHSLWQGIILAAIAGLIVICTRKSSSALRYNLLVSALLLFAISVGATFAWQYESSAVTNIAIARMRHFNTYPANVQAQPMRVFVSDQQVASPGFTAQVKDYLAGHHNTIVFIWFLIVCARSLQLAFGLYGTYRLRRVRIFAADGQWVERLQQLGDSLNIKQAVRLLESGLAKVPMVIGHLKPVILVPVGLLTALSADEVEAILIHELAHIKRRDYLVNMLQSLIEIILFFNPAVLWVSKLIKNERENCCDDLALAQNNNKLSYIRALVSCEEYKASVPAYAMGFPGGKNTLLHRVKRMVTNRNYSLNLVEKMVLAVCLVVLGLGISAFTAREDIKKAVKSIVAAIHHVAAPKAKTAATDTTKKRQTEQAKDADTILNNSAMNALVHKIDSLKVKSGDANSYLSQFGKPDTARYTQMVKDLLAEKSRTDSNLLKNLLVDRRWENSPMLARLMAKLDSSSKVFNAVANDLYSDHYLSNTSHLNITLNEKELIVNGVRLPQDVHDRYYSKYGDKFNDSSNGDNNEGSGRADYNAVNPNDAEKQTNVQDHDDKTKSIIADMLKDGIISSTDDLSFKIGTTEFVVNYKKQPEAVYRKYKAKYVPAHKKGDWIWFYQFDTNKWDQIQGRRNSEDFHGSATGVFQGKEDANASGYNSSGYNSGDYYRQMEPQKKYWDGQQRKIIDQMQRDGLIDNRNGLSFTLTDKTFVINGLVQNGEVFQRYHQQYVPANTGDNWTWSYNGSGADNTPNSNWRGRDWDAYSRQTAAEGQRVEAERDKKLVSDLLQDGLITDPNNVTFTLSDKKLMINGKKQSDETYNKYKDKYMPDNSGSGWTWNYSHHE
jgi:bla regulator protein blaR1